MAYQLQPGLKLVQNPAHPPVCATEEVFVYPQPTTLNYGSNRTVRGDQRQLRPQSTSQFNKIVTKTYDKNFFPLQDVACKLPPRTMSYEPASTRAELQNGQFQQRYLNKKY